MGPRVLISGTWYKISLIWPPPREPPTSPRFALAGFFFPRFWEWDRFLRCFWRDRGR
jgi:hypothetical protein